MADVIGPNSYLPGKELSVPTGMMCDEHEDVVATHRIVGETDSFGSELIDMCDACYAKYLEYDQKAEGDECERCGSKENVGYVRDPEEGSCGPVYHLCGRCRKSMLSYSMDCADNTDTDADVDDDDEDKNPDDSIFLDDDLRALEIENYLHPNVDADGFPIDRD